MVAFNRLTVGDELWQCLKVRQGNTTMTRTACWRVRVIEIDSVVMRARVSWNGNSPEWWSEFRIAKLRRTPKKDTHEHRR